MTYDRERLQQLGRRHKRLRADLEALRAELGPEIREGLKAGERPTDVAEWSGYTRDGIRKLLLAAEQPSRKAEPIK